MTDPTPIPASIAAYDELASALLYAASAGGNAPLDEHQEQLLAVHLRSVLISVITVDPAAKEYLRQVGLEQAIDRWAAERAADLFADDVRKLLQDRAS